MKRQKIIAGRDFEWSKKSWTHNVFRLFEVVFGRRYGIRKEAAYWVEIEDGKRVEHCELYTIEAVFAYTETMARNLFRLPKFEIVRVPQFITPQGIRFPSLQFPYMFAIAFDASALATASGSATSITWNQTCTGSNGLFVVGNQGNISGTNNISANTYNGVSCAQVGTGQNGDTGSLRVTSFWWLLNPATGSNAVITSSSPAGFIDGVSASYTGVKQSGQPDASNTGAFGSPSPALSITVVAANSWIISSGWGRTTGASGTSTTGRLNASGNGIYDSNGGLSAGSHSITATWSGGVNEGNMVGASFAPVLNTANGNLLTFM